MSSETPREAPRGGAAPEEWGAEALGSAPPLHWMEAVIESADDAIVGKKLDGTILSWNRGAERLFGYTAGEAVGRSVMMLIPPERADEESAIIGRIIRGERVEHFETVRVRKDGTRVEISLTVSPVRAPGGEIIGASKIARDVTERRRADEALRRSEQELSDFFENAPVGLHWVGEDGTILRANRAELELLGYERDEYVGRHIAEFHADREAIKDILGRLSRGETLHNYEARLRHKDGSVRHVLISSNVRNEGGKFLHTRCFTRDITGRKSAEREVEERTRIALMSADVGLALTRADSLDQMLQGCAEALVKHLKAAFARVWTLDERERVLVLRASAGMYTHKDGPHGRVPVGEFKIGLIAEERRPHLTNSVVGDPRVGDQEWAEREGMVSFAGYPLIVGGRLSGVMAMFAREPLTEATLQAMETAANGVAIGIERRRAEEERERLSQEVIRMQAARLEELSTPLIPLNDRVVLMPLIGTVDSDRAARALDALACGVRERGARIAIIDITGVSAVDTHVAGALMKAAAVLRLLGAEAVITGVRPRVAQTLVGLGVDLGSVVTRGSLQGSIEYARQRLLKDRDAASGRA